MKNRAFILVITVLALSLFSATAQGEMVILDDKLTVGSDAALGYQYTHSEGDRPSQFEAYRDVHKGFVFESIHLLGEWNDPAKPYYFRFDGIDLSQADQNLYLETGRYGEFKLGFKWVESPRLYSTGNRFMQTYQGNGVYTMLDATQTLLQIDPPTVGGTYDMFDPSNTTVLRNNLLAVINSSPSVDLRVDRERGTASYLQKLAPGLNMKLNYTHDFREGTKLTGVGVYHRIFLSPADVASGEPAVVSTSGENGERWRITMVEVPQPIDYDSDLLTFGLELTKKNWFASLQYDFQQFNNNISTLTFDNPFNLTDRNGTPSATLRGISSARYQLDLAPDSSSHTGTLSAGVDLPMNSRFTATVSAGMTLQDDPFLPFSTNTAIPTDTDPVAPGVQLASDPASLPRSSLDGMILNFVQNYVLTSRPIDKLKVTAKYRYYFYDNKTDDITLPGYSELWDAQWNAGLANGPKNPSYLRQNGSLELDNEISPMLSARADYGWERWRRWERNVARTDEHRLGGGFTVKPADWAKVMVDYHWANRKGGDYTRTTTGDSLEAAGARMFDQSNKHGHEVDARFSVSPTEGLNIAANGSYHISGFNTASLGLDEDRSWSAGADASYTLLDTINIMANYSHEESRFMTLGGSKTGAVAGAVSDGTQYSAANLFNTELLDKVDNFGVGINGFAIPDTLEFGTYYNYTRSRGETVTVNPNPRTVADSINSSQALPYDDIKMDNHEVRAEMSYHFLKHFSVNLKYTFEKFKFSDPAWNDMGSQIDQVVQDGVVVEDTQRVALLNSQFSSYDSHAAAVTLSYHF